MRSQALEMACLLGKHFFDGFTGGVSLDGLWVLVVVVRGLTRLISEVPAWRRIPAFDVCEGKCRFVIFMKP